MASSLCEGDVNDGWSDVDCLELWESLRGTDYVGKGVHHLGKHGESTGWLKRVSIRLSGRRRLCGCVQFLYVIVVRWTLQPSLWSMASLVVQWMLMWCGCLAVMTCFSLDAAL